MSRYEPIEPFDDDPTPRGWRLIGSPENAPESAATRHAIAPRGPTRTAGQRLRKTRDVVMLAASRQPGISQSMLATAFGLARSRVQVILASFDA